MKLEKVREYLKENDIHGWLIYDFQGINPVFKDFMTKDLSFSRRCFLFIDPDEKVSVKLLAHYVDAGHFKEESFEIITYRNRQDLKNSIKDILKGKNSIAMEYSPDGDIPYVSRIDAGTFEWITHLGMNVVTSADLIQLALTLWTDENLKTHLDAARKLETIKNSAFAYIGTQLRHSRHVTEYEIAEYIAEQYRLESLVSSKLPIVAVNANSSFPHYAPSETKSSVIRKNDWILMDLFARCKDTNAMYADITWVGFAGSNVPEKYKKIFQIIKIARDMAVSCLRERIEKRKPVAGYEVDRVVRNEIEKAGYGDYFIHRTGHSLGSRELHGNGVCLDDFETHDTRQILPGCAFSIEPGIYRPEFGVRSEINVFVGKDEVIITTPPQEDILRIL